ncbi:hypothetical protein NG701_04960 [Pseudarthrobacter sp. HLT3-5]|nr:hypothetical protein [Pseudarthrobacter sp. HLT3-5]MCO4273784.1 hypothetical protein [Pseudarthrobacter sp. HLT3-5]
MLSCIKTYEWRAGPELPRLAPDWLIAREATDYIAGPILCETAGVEAS